MRAAGNTAFPKKGSGGGSVPRTGMERGRRPEDRRKKMRSNVRKMWTALLAVLFAAAVGFGLWFAFAPADRPASVQAVGDTSVARVELAVTEQDIYSSIPAASLYPNFVSGYYYAANSTVGKDLSGYGS